MRTAYPSSAHGQGVPSEAPSARPRGVEGLSYAGPHWMPEGAPEAPVDVGHGGLWRPAPGHPLGRVAHQDGG
eukprot:4495508-Pyramimonas_sp.AAC.1